MSGLQDQIVPEHQTHLDKITNMLTRSPCFIDTSRVGYGVSPYHILPLCSNCGNVDVTQQNGPEYDEVWLSFYSLPGHLCRTCNVQQICPTTMLDTWKQKLDNHHAR